MTTLAHLRKSALSLPETDERRDAEAIVFAVCGKKFAALDGDGRIWLRLTGDDVVTVLAGHPAAQRSPAGLSVPLDDLNGQQLNHWLRRAWLGRAPKRLTDVIAGAEKLTPGAVGDLPKAIGAPATRALAGAGITTMAQVATLSEAELLALHGVGPKAVRLLKEAGWGA